MPKKFIFTLLMCLLLFPPTLAAHAQGPPDSIYDALADLSTRAGFTITLSDLTRWNWGEQLYADASLGCPLPGETYVQVATRGYQFVFNYNGVTFDYRATLDGSRLFLCSGPDIFPAQDTNDSTGPSATVDVTGRSVCANAMDTRLSVGIQAAASETGIPKNIRSKPTTSGGRVGQVQPGERVDIIGGPECADNMVWWQVQYGALTGWCAEGQYGVYWFEPTSTPVETPSATTPEPASGDDQTTEPVIPSEPQVYMTPGNSPLIMPDNAAQLIAFVDLPVGETVRDVAWSPDGATLAVAGMSGTWLFSSAAYTLPPRLLQVPNGPVYAVVFSPDGITMATAHHDTLVRFWDISTGGLRATLRGHMHPVTALAITPDGTRLASGDGDDSTGEGGIIQLWDAAGTLIATLQGHTGPITSLAFSPDGTLLASSSADGSLRLWDVVSATPVSVLTETGDPVWAVTFNVDGTQLISARDDGTVRVWDIATGNFVTLIGHTDRVIALALSPDGMILASAGGGLADLVDNSVRLWDMTTGLPLGILDNYGATTATTVTVLTFDADGTLLAFVTDEGGPGVVRIWGVSP